MISTESLFHLHRSFENAESDGWKIGVYDNVDNDCFSEQIVSNMNQLQLDDGDVTSDKEEEEEEEEEEETETKRRLGWPSDSDSSEIDDISDIIHEWPADNDISDIIDDEVDISQNQHRVRPPPLFRGFMLLPVTDRGDSEVLDEHFRMDAEHDETPGIQHCEHINCSECARRYLEC